MSTMSPDERDQLAAEYALGLLVGDELQRARALHEEDAAFRDATARWSGRLAPLLDEVAPVRPPGNMWPKIARNIRGGDNVVTLRRRVGLWRGVAVAASAVAASLAMVVVTRPAEVAPTAIAGPAPMVAMLGDDKQAMKLVASWNPSERRLMIAAASDMPGDPGHAHEVWMIPADGKPRSLGTMPGPKMRAEVADPMASQLRDGVTLAVSVEPMGGSPTGAPTGPVIASGKLERA